jgi:hypothetical protein
MKDWNPEELAATVRNAVGRGDLIAFSVLCSRYDIERLIVAKRQVLPGSEWDIIIQEAINKLRHEESVKHNWTLVPTFWLVLAGTITGITALVIACLAWREPIEPQSDVSAIQERQRSALNPISPILPEKPTPQAMPLPTPTPAPTNSVAIPASPKN